MKDPGNRFIVFLLGLVFIFLCVRSVLVDMTHDEAYSFLNIKHFWYAQFLCNANSHWINSFGMKCASIFGLERPWQLRWLSLVSAATIFYTGYRWIRTFNLTSAKLFAFALAFLNPFVLDYFVLARGYVSGMAFEALTLFFFITYLKKQERRFVRIALFCSGLSAIANFNFFYFYLAFLVVYFSHCYFVRRKEEQNLSKLSFLKNKAFYFDGLVALGFILLVLRALLFIKRCSNDFGLGDTNFFECLFSSYIDGLLYGNEGLDDFDMYAIILFIVSITSIIHGIFFFRKHNNAVYFYSSVIFSIYLFLIVFNHICFGVLYPYYRSSLPMFPLLVINLVSFLYFVTKSDTVKNISFYFLFALLVINFLWGINFHSTIDFLHQCDSKASFEIVEKLGAKKVGLSHEHQGVYINYYQATDNFKYNFDGKLLNTYNEDPNWTEKDKLEDFDYLILYPPYNLSYYKKRKIKFAGVTVFPTSKTVVLRVIN